MDVHDYIIDYFAECHTPYLHTHGEQATQLLASRLPIENEDRILELGPGTGATLVRLVDHNPQADFVALESNKAMLVKCVERLRYCKTPHPVRLVTYAKPNIIPFEDGYFDRIYFESVLALQDRARPAKLLREINRVLRPGGTLVFNETVWLPNITREEITNLNASFRKRFNIIQANERFPYAENWEVLLRQTGFQVRSVEHLDELLKDPDYPKPLPVHRPSRKFTQWGSLKGRMSDTLRRTYDEFARITGLLMRGKNYLEGILVVAEKPLESVSIVGDEEE